MTRSGRNTRDGDAGAGPMSSRSRNPKFPKSRFYTRNRNRRLAMLGGQQEGRSNVVDDRKHWEGMSVLKAHRKGPGEGLNVANVNFNKSKNGVAHHTDHYEIDDLVVRRGQNWTLTLEFDRPIDAKADVVTLQLAFGNLPKESKGTLLRMKLNLDGSTFTTRKWSAKVEGIEGSSIDVEISSPANALIGKYGVFVETELKDKKDSLARHEVEDEDVILLFNPWSDQDVVHMDNEVERDEYVLNDRGRIWVGTATNNRGRPWYFGQFENPVLEAALSLLDAAEIGDTARSSPVTFIRALSALTNSCDDDGVLEGRWSQDYPDGCTKPWAWGGSVKIIKSYMKNKESVKFGQCWVFSGVITTLLRAVGIPTRSVTNFASAHDKDNSMTIDTHFRENGDPVTWMDDSVWNFHVWNESFFRRLDLPAGYDGWQAHDSTPQESSEGVMRCGPAPLRAIKEGHVYLNYDVPFIFSEVNGDKVEWMVLEDGSMFCIDTDTNAVGKNISTKAVMSDMRHDITHLYKYPEGSEDERRVVKFVHRFSSRSEEQIYDSNVVRDVKFTLKFSENTQIGETLKVSVHLKSNSAETRFIKGTVTVLSSYYTGVPGKRIKFNRFIEELSPLEEKELELELTADEYLSKLHPEASVNAYALFSVTETGQKFARNSAFTLLKPNLDMQLYGDLALRKSATGVVEFTNPLSIPLTNGVINLEGSSITSKDTFTISNAIKPSEKVVFQFDVCPRRRGSHEIAATFTSDQLSGVDGFAAFDVSDGDQN